MLTTADLPKMPCFICKEEFWPRIPPKYWFILKKDKKHPTWEWWFCEQCIPKAQELPQEVKAKLISMEGP